MLNLTFFGRNVKKSIEIPKQAPTRILVRERPEKEGKSRKKWIVDEKRPFWCTTIIVLVVILILYTILLLILILYHRTGTDTNINTNAHLRLVRIRLLI